MTFLARTLVAPLILAMAVASPALADGKKGTPYIANPVAPLQMPEEAPAPVVPPVAPVVLTPTQINLPASFGDGGVGAGVSGGFIGGGSHIVFVNSGSRANGAASAFAFASATAISQGGFSQLGFSFTGGRGCGCQ